MRSIIAGGALLLIVPASLAIASGFREGPLPAMTGGFGEKTCHTCHFDNRENTPGGSLRVDGIPATYEAGREYAITVVLRRPDIGRAGFEMSARIRTGPEAGRQAGTLRGNDDTRTQIVFAPGGKVQYVQHTKTGSILTAAGEGRWNVHWMAPRNPGVGAVIFNIAANAANDDASALGDFIYSTSITSRPSAKDK